jgi:protein TonB
METKKDQRANLENKRSILFQAGLVSAMAAVLILFEWSSPPRDNKDIIIINDPEFDTEYMLNTRQSPPEKPLPPEPTVTDELQLVDNNVELERELDLDVGTDIMDDVPFIYNLKAEKTVKDSIFKIVERMPKFQGKEQDAFRVYIQKHVNYSQTAINNGIEGKVYVQFVVNTSGKVVNAQIYRGVHPLLDEAALEVVKSSPEWTPGMQRDKKVNVQFVFPIYFKVANR